MTKQWLYDKYMNCDAKCCLKINATLQIPRYIVSMLLCLPDKLCNLTVRNNIMGVKKWSRMPRLVICLSSFYRSADQQIIRKHSRFTLCISYTYVTWLFEIHILFTTFHVTTYKNMFVILTLLTCYSNTCMHINANFSVIEHPISIRHPFNTLVVSSRFE